MTLEKDTRYQGVIRSVEWVESTKKKTDGLDVEVEITGGPTAGCEGARLIATIWITDGNVEITRATLKELGVTKEQLADAAFWRQPGAVLVGADCSIITEVDDYGELRVKYLNGPNRSRNRPAPDAKGAAGRALALMQGRDARKSSVPPPANRASRGPLAGTPPKDDDEVPF